MNHSIQRALWLVGLTASLAACATMSDRQKSALAEATSAVQTLEADPLASQSAGKALQDARDGLNAATTAAQHHEDDATVEHLAYLARRQAELGEAQVSEQRAEQQVAQAQAQRDRVLLQAREREADAARDQARSAQAQAEAQTEAANAAQQQAQAAQRQNADLQAQLQAMAAKPTSKGEVVTLNNVLFDVNGTTLKPAADEELGRVANFLKDHPQMSARVEGNTDSTGSDGYNQTLSKERADSVASALESRGVDTVRVQTIGRGKNDPIATNASAEGRQQNRRVEIVFSDERGQFASTN